MGDSRIALRENIKTYLKFAWILTAYIACQTRLQHVKPSWVNSQGQVLSTPLEPGEAWGTVKSRSDWRQTVQGNRSLRQVNSPTIRIAFQFWEVCIHQTACQWNDYRTSVHVGLPFDIGHAMKCKKGGFVYVGHINARGGKAQTLRENRHSGTATGRRTHQSKQESTSKIRRQRAFYDVRIFDSVTHSHLSLYLTSTSLEKSVAFSERSQKTEHGPFTTTQYI